MKHRPTSDQLRACLITEGIAKAGDVYEDFCHCPGCHKLLDAELVQYGMYPLPWAWCAKCRMGVRMYVDWYEPRYETVNMNKKD